jgi:hypothetical protein
VNRGTRRRALRAVPPLVALVVVGALTAPAHADPPPSTGAGGPSHLTVAIAGPSPNDGGPQAAIAASRTEHVVVVTTAGLPPPIIDD